MKQEKIAGFLDVAGLGMTQFLALPLALALLVCSGHAAATAPRITPQLFGEARSADIVGYPLAPPDAAARSDGELAVAIVTAGFKAVGMTPTLDVLPAKQLATYALFKNEAVALIGSPQDVAQKDRKRYRMVTLYLRGAVPGGEPVALIFSKDAREMKWHRAFNEGLQKIIKNGMYLEILKRHHARGDVPAAYLVELKRHNSGWK